MLGTGAHAMTKPALSLGGGGGGHGSGCACCETDKAMMQTVSEVGFEKGIWGKIIRGANADQIAKYLQERGCEHANLPDESGYTPLLYAVRQGNGPVCEVLLAAGADPNAATPGFKSTGLHRAAMMGHGYVALLLLRHGAAPARDGHGKWPSEVAAEKGFPGLAATLHAVEAAAAAAPPPAAGPAATA